MKKSALIWISFLLAITLKAQDTIVIDSVKLELTKEIEQACDFFAVDQLGNIYLVNDDKIDKYNANGELIFSQSYKSLGEITSIDATQSLRTMLFYRDLTQIVFVDNTLSIQGESIKLEKEGLTFVTMACASFVNNHFWVYNTDDFTIKRLDKQLKLIASSGNLVQIIGKEISPEMILENGDKVYLYDDAVGIMVFDLFGTYIQTLPITGISSFQADGEHILYLEDNELMIYSTLNFLPAKLDLPIEGVNQILKVKNQLVLSNGKSIRIYKLSPK